jgi:hypothetical protein
MFSLSGLSQLFAQSMRDAAPHPAFATGQGCREICDQTLPAPAAIASTASGSVKAMPCRGACARLDPASKRRCTYCSRKASFTKRL